MKISYRKGDGRYYVHLDGTKAGWVIKRSDGWSFYAPVRESLTAERLSTEPTREGAVVEGLSSLRIFHGGTIFRLDHDTFKDELFTFPAEDLKTVWTEYLDRKYGV